MRSHSPSMVIKRLFRIRILKGLGHGNIYCDESLLFDQKISKNLKNGQNRAKSECSDLAQILVMCSLGRVRTLAKKDFLSGFSTYHFNDPLERELWKVLRRKPNWVKRMAGLS